MSGRLLITLILILFVIAGTSMLLWQNSKDSDAPSTPPGEGDRVVAFYFHGMTRCTTCKKIESAARTVLETDFAPQLATGSIIWAPVNIELTENRHYTQDFEMPTRTLVLAKMNGDQMERWQRLDEVWTLSSDEEALLAYIREQATEFLGSAS